MRSRILTVSSVGSTGASLTLSDGFRYAVLAKDQPVVKAWPVGHVVKVIGTPDLPGGYVIRSMQLPTEVVGAMSARPSTRRI